MESIITKYYLETDSKLIKYSIGTNGVDCWFDTNKVRQHRCLTYKDFNKIK